MKQAVSQQIYDRIDNDMYQYDGDKWWTGNNVLHPAEGFRKSVQGTFLSDYIPEHFKKKRGRKAGAEVGCGGGILAEEIASAGFRLTGIDPAERSLKTAREHAKVYNLNIDYRQGAGEHLDFQTIISMWSFAAMYWNM